ncbi:MAG: NUDIX hydrolase [Parcubacteria group bacterium]|nr:NUDIX hydrolase [Parcubacteria group bacterium]
MKEQGRKIDIYDPDFIPGVNEPLLDGMSCFCAGIPFEIARASNGHPRKVYFRVIPYTTNSGRTQIKFSGGTNKSPHESPLNVLRREIKEELGVDGLKAELIYSAKKVDKDAHVKYFFLLNHWEGCFFPNQRQIRDDQVGPSSWEEPIVLEKVLFRGHLPALYAAVGHLAKDPLLFKFFDEQNLLVKDPAVYAPVYRY